jgi:two-component system, cell cycle sensor histidine kinase DivJ
MEWVDDWLTGLVHRSAQADPAERLRHERFIVARTVTALVALAGLPPYLLARQTPTALECFALLALASPLAAVFVVSRFGSLSSAQAMVSVGVTLFVASAAAAFGGAGALSALTLLVVPLDAMLCGSRRALQLTGVIALAGLPFLAMQHASGIAVAEGSALAVLFTVAAALCLGHAVAQSVADRRLQKLLLAARRTGDNREGASLQAIDDLVTWHDRNGSVLRANAAASRLVGVSATALQGRGLFARIHVTDRPAFLKAISDAAGSDEPVAVQFRLRTGELPAREQGGGPAHLAARSAGPLIWAEMRAHRLTDGEGCAVVAITRDISGHKDLADDLETLRQEAVSAGESRAQLLATVSHELRTPLNAIIGYAEMLMGRGGIAAPARGDQRHDYAEIIQQSGHHMLGVVNTLLDLSTIEAGHYELAREPVEVSGLVQECCRYMALTADRSGVALAQDVAPGLPELTADRRACQQILLNLLSNAVKFTPKGGLIRVLARRDGDRIALSVSDTGVGVSESELPRLGNPFYKASSVASHAEKGTGLGLSVVRGLVGLHNGRISIASARGDGTMVTVSLPIDASQPARPAMPAQVHTIVRSPDGTRAIKTGTTNRA